jgi:FkbM family methyltransferase
MEYYSQFGQDKHIINTIYKNKRKGYFVDIGAYDGIAMSNTYLLEKEYEWKGICVEANPRYFNKLKDCRTSININNAIYKDDYEELEFIDDEVGGCSGIKHTNSHLFLKNSPIIKVKTRNLTSLLDEHNAPNYIEYLSIDTEGSEFDILNAHDFNKYKFGYITVEHNFINENRIKIRNLLIKNGYILYRENNVDDDYILNIKKGIFYNSKKSMCSIYESGLMVYNCLKKSDMYHLDYTEDTTFLYDYDFCIVNEHLTVNNWITKEMITKFNKSAFCIVTEVSFSKNCISESPNFYTAYIVLDISIDEQSNIYGFPRPLEDFYVIQPYNNDINIPIIGSFGFATFGKSWYKIVEETQKDFEEAIIRFNIPFATYIPDNESRINYIISSCKSVLKNPKIKLEITNFNFSKEELIKWCSENTINCFIYEREHLFTAGLCATTDQAIVSERPLLVSKDITFRHIHKYIDYYPNISIKQAIENTIDGVKKMKEDWSSKKFLQKFEHILILHEKEKEN